MSSVLKGGVWPLKPNAPIGLFLRSSLPFLHDVVGSDIQRSLVL